MKSRIPILLTLSLLVLSCQKDEPEREVEIPDWNFAKTHAFEEKLSSYTIFQGDPSN
jgi:hypothetical protein